MEVAKLHLTLGNAEREFLYRKGSLDEAVVVQDLKTSACDIGRLRRGAELNGLYEELAAGGKTPLIIDVSANIGAAAVFFNYKFPQARIVALEADPGKFELLKANTAGLPVECMRARAGAASGGDDARRVTVETLYDRTAHDAAPFIVKLDVERDINLVTTDNGWIARTPVIVASLSDYLVPGTTNSRALVEAVTALNRDLVYMEDNVFLVERAVAACC